MTDNSSPAPARTPAKAQRVLVLQGGGALGSYQAGAYQALCHHDFEPDWVAGISIGAVNAAIIAGNPREKRVERLRNSGRWSRRRCPGVRSPGRSRPLAVQRNQRRPDRDLRRSRLLQAADSAGPALAAGHARSRRAITIPARCAPRWSVWSISTASTRWRPGSASARSASRSGNFRYFDNFEFKKQGKKIGPEHIMASGALPPGFPVDRDRGRAFLGRRHRLQHAARLCAGRRNQRTIS